MTKMRSPRPPQTNYSNSNSNSNSNNDKKTSSSSSSNYSITTTSRVEEQQPVPRSSSGLRYHKMKNLFGFNKSSPAKAGVVVAAASDTADPQEGGTYHGSISCTSSHAEAHPISPNSSRHNRTAAGTRRNLQRQQQTAARRTHQQQQQSQQPQQQHTTSIPTPAPTPSSNMFSANGRNGYQFTDVYRKTADVQLDKGNFGFIYKCENLLVPPSSPYKVGAVKVCQPNDLDKMAGPIVTYDDVETKCQEIRNLVLLNHQQPPCPTILHLYEYFYNPRTMELHLVTELLQMNLRDWIVQQPRFTEDEGREVARVVLKAIQFMHSHNVMHRDIKEANVVFRQNGNIDSLVIVDFGLAKELLEPNQKERVFCGSLGYIAPEVYMQEPYAYEVDLFSFGVLLFKILSGKRPWPSGPAEETRRRTENLEYRIIAHEWKGVSQYGQDLIRKLLVFKEERLNAKEALKHEWIGENTGTILRVQPPSRRPSMGNNSPSDAVILPNETRRADSREGATFWIDENVQKSLVKFMSYGAYHCNVLDQRSGEALIEETKPMDATLLPHYVMSLEVYTERECRCLSREIARRLHLFHKKGNVVHRKLHLENVLVENHIGNTGFNVSLRGVQYAQMIRKDIPLTGRVGRRNQFRSWHAFIAPEIETKFYHDQNVDMWSLGAIIYTLLCGVAPVKGGALFEVVQPSALAQSLVRRLLQEDPRRRMSIDEVLRHPWMNEQDDVLVQHDLFLAKMIFGDYCNTGA